MASGAPLSQTVLRSLSDRSYEKRKAGAQEVEAKITQLVAAGDGEAVMRLLGVLANDLCRSPNIFHRKGGLTGLAAAAVALAPKLNEYLRVLVPPVLKCFEDQESRVRYYACEAMFNIVKVGRSLVLQYFNDIFVGICYLVADVADSDVRSGAGVLNRKMKDIVTECEAFDIESFVPLLRLHIASPNPYVRQLTVGWITALDSVPEIDMLDYLAEFLGGLFDMLSDGNKEIRQQAFRALSEFLEQINSVTSEEEFQSRVNFTPMIDVLVRQTSNEQKFNRVTAVEWLCQFITLGKGKMIAVLDKLVGAVLRCFSDRELDIVDEAERTNTALLELVTGTAQEFPLGPIVDAVTAAFALHEHAPQAAALAWVEMLLKKCPDKLMNFDSQVLEALLKHLAEVNSSDVLRSNLAVIGKMSAYDPRFLRLSVLPGIVKLLADNRHLLETRCSFIIRSLCKLLDPTQIYLSLARILLRWEDYEFVTLTIEILNLLLLTASELVTLRDVLRSCFDEPAKIPLPALPAHKGVGGESGGGAGGGAGGGPALSDSVAGGSRAGGAGAFAGAGASAVPDSAPAIADAGGDEGTDSLSSVDIFQTLYATWSNNPIATLSLCLLAQEYELGCALVSRFAETQITVGMLMQVDKLVQLLESPVFVHTRMHLLEPSRPDLPFLLRSLYGLLMLLPQGPAFTTLRDRLTSVTSLHIAMANHTGRGDAGAGALVSASRLSGDDTKRAPSHVDCAALLRHFVSVQERHAAAVRAALRESASAT